MRVGMSRSAVMGKASRNRDLFPRRRPVGVKHSVKVKRAAAPKPVKAPPPKPSKSAPSLSAAALHIVGQRFEKIKDFGQCKFPLDRDSVNDENMLCCGLPAEMRVDARGYVRSSSWCAAHEAVVFRDRRQSSLFQSAAE